MSKPPTPSAPHRPLSPHLQVWRYHITMFTSILHRITGVATIAGLLLGAAWLVALGATASGLCPEAYTTYLTFAASPLGLLIWFGVTLAGFIHLTGGLRHLIWDMGQGFDLRTSNLMAWSGLVTAVLATIAVWFYLFATGKVAL